MAEVIRLFDEPGKVDHTPPRELFSKVSDVAVDADKGLAIVIDCHGASGENWMLNWHATNMTNAEVLMTLEILHYKVIHSVMGASQ